MIFIHEKNGAVVMTAKNKNNIADKFLQTSITLKSGEKEKIESNNYDISIKGKKLGFTEKEDFKIQKEREEIKQDVEKIQDKTIKNLFKKLIK